MNKEAYQEILKWLDNAKKNVEDGYGNAAINNIEHVQFLIEQYYSKDA